MRAVAIPLTSFEACIHSPPFEAVMAALHVMVLVWMLLLAVMFTSFKACIPFAILRASADGSIACDGDCLDAVRCPSAHKLKGLNHCPFSQALMAALHAAPGIWMLLSAIPLKSSKAGVIRHLLATTTTSSSTTTTSTSSSTISSECPMAALHVLEACGHSPPFRSSDGSIACDGACLDAALCHYAHELQGVHPLATLRASADGSIACADAVKRVPAENVLTVRGGLDDLRLLLGGGLANELAGLRQVPDKVVRDHVHGELRVPEGVRGVVHRDQIFTERSRDLHASVKKLLHHALQLGVLQALIQDLIQGVVLVLGHRVGVEGGVGGAVSLAPSALRPARLRTSWIGPACRRRHPRSPAPPPCRPCSPSTEDKQDGPTYMLYGCQAAVQRDGHACVLTRM